MDNLSQLVEERFPLDSFRTHQKETIIEAIEAFNSGKRCVVIEAPTGTGKSVIGVTIANIIGNTYYLTIQKNLQTDIERKFDNAFSLKGRNAYPCWMINDHMEMNNGTMANRGLCVKKNVPKLDICSAHCEYFKAIDQAQVAHIAVFNFSSFLYQKLMAKRFQEQRKLLIIDECHNISSQIMGFVELQLDGDDIGIEIPEYDTAQQYLAHFESINLFDMLVENKNHAIRELKQATDEEREEDAERMIPIVKKWEGLISKYAHFVEYVNNVECVAEYKEGTVTIKPLKASYHAPRLLLSSGYKQLLMSATVLDIRAFCSEIGINIDDVHYIRVPHTFPVDHRLIHLEYAGSMKFKHKNTTIPKLINKIAAIMENHQSEKGIIHCQSFALMKDIMNGLPRKQSKRIICQLDYKNKDEMLDDHKNRENSVIIGPALHEGISLDYDLSRFQIICKVSYPSTRDNKQLAERVKNDWRYYVWLTATKMVQSYGRSIRAPDDEATTYILDSEFTTFLGHCQKFDMLPQWFTEAIRLEGQAII